MLEAPQLPAGARVFNALAGPLAGWLPQLSLEPESLLRAAQRSTGFGDFGDSWFLEGFEILTQALREEAELTPIGRTIARTDILMGLENRLQLQHWRTAHPEIAEERVEAPVVIIGMARTGTTILHNLLTKDRRNRVPMTWEADHPAPPPREETRDDDPRIAEVDLRLDRVDRLIPDFKKMHPMGALHPQECVRLLSTEFASMIYELSFRVPSYRQWLHQDANLREAYRGHRRFLQHLQWRHPGRWMLKSPCHLWHLDALMHEYPDAVLVQTHRDPLSILSSLTSLATTLRAMCGRSVSPLEIAEEWAELNAQAFDKSVDARESGLVDPSRVIDIQFRDLVRDPLGTVKRVYDLAGMEMSDEAAAAIQGHWDANPADKHGKHEHRFSETGLDFDTHRERVRRYQEHFDVRTEVQR
jgi:hypothetical protein